LIDRNGRTYLEAQIDQLLNLKCVLLAWSDIICVD
jgi:hypothetical protein